jgi:3-phenylpropionate/trans-cinnamate dioxygenase ferredoxin subunit
VPARQNRPLERNLSDTAYVPVLPLADLAAGQMRCVEVGLTPVLVVHAKDGGLHALHNVCSHAYARMDEGRLRGHRLICPLHGASFDVRTGAVLGAPATVPLSSYPVRVVDGQIEVQV